MRNAHGLTQRQVAYCLDCWEVLGGERFCSLDTSQASRHSSRTAYREGSRSVLLGADAYPNPGAIDARSRLSVLACLAHECSHAERHQQGYGRTVAETRIDEAEASLNASCYPPLSSVDRIDLVEDARDRILEWLDDTARSAP